MRSSGAQRVAEGQRVERREPREVPATEKPIVTAKPLVVERITHQDIPEVCALFKRVWESFEPKLPADLLKAWTPAPLEFTSWMEGVTYFAARKDRQLVGIVGCEHSEGSCRIVHLAVDPGTRREGTASALVAAAVDWAKHSGCRAIWVDALARFQAAADLFRHLDFAESGVLHRRVWGEDVRLFEKLL